MRRMETLIALIVAAIGMNSSVLADALMNIEQRNTGWALQIDNDLLVGSDQDYTGGLSIAISGSRATRSMLSVDTLRESLNALSGFTRAYERNHHFNLHSLDAGFALYTPSDISRDAPQHNDHPYASVFFLSNTQQAIVPAKRIAFQSVMTVGLLGLPLAKDIQSALHESTGSEIPKGWNHQISAGGEPTARYTIGVRRGLLQSINQDRFGFELNVNSEANIGFTTDLNAGFNLRWGRLATPWWSFAPHQDEYVKLGSAAPNSANYLNVKEFFFYAGGALRYRLYNALLQGQFRHSEVTFGRSELEALIGEVWAGVNIELPSRLRIGVFARARSSEFDDPQSRSPVWGGISISRSN